MKNKIYVKEKEKKIKDMKLRKKKLIILTMILSYK